MLYTGEAFQQFPVVMTKQQNLIPKGVNGSVGKKHAPFFN